MKQILHIMESSSKCYRLNYAPINFCLKPVHLMAVLTLLSLPCTFKMTEEEDATGSWCDMVKILFLTDDSLLKKNYKETWDGKPFLTNLKVSS